MATARKIESTSAERIVAAATDLFSRYGYEGVTTRQLAAETGLNISTINHHVGSKRSLYLRVIENLFEAEESLVGEILDQIDDTVILDPVRFQEALFRLIGRILEFAHTNPARQRLYVRRWLEPPDELRAREAELTLLLYRRLARILKRGQKLGAVRPSLDVGYFLRSFDFLIFSYFTSGAFDWQALRTDPLHKANLTRFRSYLLDYTKQMLENAQ